LPEFRTCVLFLRRFASAHFFQHFCN
jgi:hypothetical protein